MWQHITTAPTDGTQILLKREPSGYQTTVAIADGYRCRGFWVWPYVHKTPTHWMPIPE